RTNYNVELEHWLFKLCEMQESDFVQILDAFQVDRAQLLSDLTRFLDRLKTGNAKPPALSPDVVNLAKMAWSLATIDYGAGQIRTSHLLAALLSDELLRRSATNASREFERMEIGALRKSLPELCSGSAEDQQSVALVTGSKGPARPGAKGGSVSVATPSLDQFTIDLTARA
ncbi:MAG: Clp protease N-terminal domain-containing protein, partial [Pirellulaceae bacterium]